MARVFRLTAASGLRSPQPCARPDCFALEAGIRVRGSRPLVRPAQADRPGAGSARGGEREPAFLLSRRLAGPIRARPGGGWPGMTLSPVAARTLSGPVPDP